MIVPKCYDLGCTINEYLQSGLNFKEIHKKYFSNISYDTVLEYHRLYMKYSQLLDVCMHDPDSIYNLYLDVRTIQWISIDAETDRISKISPQFISDINTYWRKVTDVEYIQIRDAFTEYFGVPEYHVEKVTRILNYSLTDIVSWFNQYNDVRARLSVKQISDKYNIKPYILQANMRRWVWLGTAIKSAIENNSAIEHLRIDSRYYKILSNNGVKYIEQIENMTDTQLKSFKGIKDKVISLIRVAVSEYKNNF